MRSYILSVIVLFTLSFFTNIESTTISIINNEVRCQKYSNSNRVIFENIQYIKFNLSEFIETEQDEDDELYNNKSFLIASVSIISSYQSIYSIRLFFKKKLTDFLLNVDIPPPFLNIY